MAVNAWTVNIVETQPSIRAAIERSRHAREAFGRRRRRVAIAATLCIAASVPLSLAVLGVTGGDVVHAAASGATSLAELLDQRSPGERTNAQLTKTKKFQHALAKFHGVAPPDMGQPDTPSALDLAKILLPPAQVPTEMPVALLQAGPPPALETIIIPPGGGGGGTPTSPPGGSIVSPPGGGGGGPNPTPPQIITGPSAVPEPGTWATMLLGFGLLGWRVRREKRKLVRSVS